MQQNPVTACTVREKQKVSVKKLGCALQQKRMVTIPLKPRRGAPRKAHT